MRRDTLKLIESQPNSIGFLRLACALAVIFGHSFQCGHFRLEPLVQISNNQTGTGRISVDVFFCFSGYLIAWSFLKKESVFHFLWNRFLRIYPALWVCIGLTGVLLASVLRGGPDFSYVSHNALLLTGWGNSIPGLFHKARDYDVNGSIWTLPWEIRAYLLIAVLGVAKFLSKPHIVMGLFLGAWANFVIQIYTYPGVQTSPAVTSGSRLITFFMCGALFYLYRGRIPVNRRLFLLSLLVLVSSLWVGTLLPPYSGGFFYAAAPLPLTYAVFYLAVRLPFSNINSKTDLSYGSYLYGTLTLNILTEFGFNKHWVTYFCTAAFITLIAATLSWYLIERPVLRLKRFASSS